jgi:carboxyl-terminal processing protease
MRKRVFLLAAILFTTCIAGTNLLSGLSASALGQSQDTSEKATPDGLYSQVWTLVDTNYYDQTFHEQDWNRWRNRYDGKLNTLADSYKAIETMLASLSDPYTRFLNPEAFAQENNAISAKLYGIGIQMAPDQSHNIVVIAPIENSPAARAGLMPMDIILEVDGKSTKGLAVDAVSRMIKGDINTPVTIKILRGKETKAFKMVRAEIHIKSVSDVKMLTPEIGYLRLSTFMSQTAGDEVRDALSKLSPARGIILDLRGNPGGLVTNALEICNIFLDGGIIVSTVDRQSHLQAAYAKKKPFYSKPVVVLINAGSASASEITSGALKDNNRAQLIGEKSFGKGLVQSVNRLQGDCGINLTIARYLTPSGTDIHKKGITPDYLVPISLDDYKKAKGPWWADPNGPTAKRKPEDLKDIQLKRAVEILGNKLDNAQESIQLHLDSPLIIH